MLPVNFECSLDITKAYEEDGRWIVEGFAATSDFDMQEDIITDRAIHSSAKDLLENSTVLHNHSADDSIGKVLDSQARKGGLYLKIMISKTVPVIWQQIKEGVLNKFSVRGKIIDAVKRWIPALQKFARLILKMRLVEVSLVAVPANPKARAIRWYVEKALEEFEKAGGELSETREDDMRIELVKDAALGRKIKTLRERLEMSREEFSRKIGVQAGTVGEIENGNIDRPPMERLQRIARALDITLRELVRDTGLADVLQRSLEGEDGDPGAGDDDPSRDELLLGVGDSGGDDDPKKTLGGFPTPDKLDKEWSEHRKTAGLEGKSQDEVFKAWVQFCKDKGYPAPFPYPYPKEEFQLARHHLAQVMAILERLIAGEKDAERKGMLQEVRSLLSAPGYPSPSAQAKTDEPEPSKTTDAEEGSSGDPGDIDKAGRKISSARLSRLKKLMGELQGLITEAEDAPGDPKKPQEGSPTPDKLAEIEGKVSILSKALGLPDPKKDEKTTPLLETLQNMAKRLETLEATPGSKTSLDGQEDLADEESGGKKLWKGLL